MNPEYFDIKNLKMFGMWPHQSFISRGIAPYINRIRKDKVSVVIIGDNKGEHSVDLLDLCGDKIEKIYVVNQKNDDLIEALFKTNTKDHDKIVTRVKILEDDTFDVWCVDEHSCDLETLKTIYPLIPSNAIFCGNGHETIKVKEALTSFRRSSKIGTPIQVANRCIWFWYKR